MSSLHIPTLDISQFDSAPDTFARDFGSAYQEWGFAGITGHNIPPSAVADAMQAAQWLFNLPLSTKQQYQQQSSWARGYVPFGLEKAKGSAHSDLKEFYHLGREHGSSESLGANIWPSNNGLESESNKADEFKLAFSTLYRALDQLSLKILSAAALSLGLDKDFFTPRVTHGEALLRILHYPPIADANVPNVRAAAHEDINLITLLVGSEQEGLEVLSRRGEWVPISMIEGTVICNVGDMMQRLTNGKLPSTTHRVVNPKGEKARQSRYSIPFFVHPEPNMPLTCLPQCVTANNPKKFEDISAGDYHRQRLQEIGFTEVDKNHE